MISTRQVRLGALTAALAVLVTGSIATALPKETRPACNLITDSTDDAKLLGVGPSIDSMDIVSADVVSAGNQLTAVIRVKKWSEEAEPLALTDLRQYSLSFRIPRSNVWLFLAATFPVHHLAARDGFGQYTWVVSQNEVAPGYVNGVATGGVYPDRGEIRIVLPLDDANTKTYLALSPGMTIDRLAVDSRGRLDQAAGRPPVDAGDSKATYVLGDASCVKPGLPDLPPQPMKNPCMILPRCP